jgi:hypothetical protein
MLNNRCRQLCLILTLFMAFPLVLFAQQIGKPSAVDQSAGSPSGAIQEPSTGTGPAVVLSVHHGLSRPLWSLPTTLEEPVIARPELPFLSARQPNSPPVRTVTANKTLPPLEQTLSSSELALAALPGLSFEGLGQGQYGFQVATLPPDTDGAIGTMQYVQWVNTSYAVFSKVDGRLVAGPFAGNTLWTGFGGACETTNNGDPVVQFDKLAARWVLTQFAAPVAPATVLGVAPPFTECIAVSTTADATGTWNLYSYEFLTDPASQAGPNNPPAFNDYPKLAVWPDSYLITYNMFDQAGNNIGGRICAYDRNAMLNGLPNATSVCFQRNDVEVILPSDLDGTRLPPSGSASYAATLFAGTSSVWLFRLHVDFSNPGVSTFLGPTAIQANGFSTVCNICIPEPGTANLLEAVSDRPMYRLAYRNFGDHESLIFNYTLAADITGGPPSPGWFEVRNPGGVTLLAQQGIYSPDGTSSRWMGSIAMDKVGDALLGYSVGAATLFPSIGIAGRTPSDPLGTLEAETIAVPGQGSQTGAGTQPGRWGDYSAMTVDPVDDCTFWYTNEYFQVTTAFQWNTKILNFKFPTCASTPDFTIGVTPSGRQVVANGASTYSVSIALVNGFASAVSLSASGLPAGVTASFNPASVTGANSSILTVSAGSSALTGSYSFNVTATGGGTTLTGAPGNVSHSATATLAVSDFSILATPTVQAVAVGKSTTYNISLSTLNNFGDNVSLSVTGLPTGATASFSPATVNGTSSSSTLTIATSLSTPLGNYSLMVTGTDGSVTRMVPLTLIVTDFQITASPASQAINAGGSTTYTVSTNGAGGFGFSDDIALSISGLPAGAVATFGPSSIPGTGSSTLTITTSTITPIGSFALSILGTSGPITHQATVGITVNPPIGNPTPDFLISATPASTTVARGTNANYTVTGTAFNGFSGSIGFSVSGQPAGVTASFSPASITPGTSSTLTLGISSTTSPGTYLLTITGTSGTLSHTSTVILNVSGSLPDFTVSVSPASQAVLPGGSITYTVNVTSLNDFTGTVTPSVTGLPVGATASFNPATIAGSGTSTLTIATLGTAATGNSTLSIFGTSGTNVHTAIATFSVVDFSVAATPSTQTVNAGSCTTYAFTATAVNGFTGTVTPSVTGLPAGATATFNPTTITGGAGTTSISVCTTSAAQAGTSTLAISGTSAAQVRSASVTLSIQPAADFTLTVAPLGETQVIVGGTVFYSVTMQPLNGFMGTVTLSLAGLPSGATASLSPSSLTNGVALQSDLIISVPITQPLSNSTLTITGTSGSLVHSASTTLSVVDVGLSVSPSSKSLIVGGSVTYTLTITPFNGFDQAADPSVSSLPTGTTATFNPSFLNGGGTMIMTVTTSSTTPLGTHVPVVSITAGPRVDTAGVTLIVQPVPDFTLSLSPSSQSVLQGDSVSYSAIANANSTCALSGGLPVIVTDLPAGATASSIAGTQSGTSTVTVATSTSTPIGTYTLSISASGCGTTHIGNVSLTVSAPAPPPPPKCKPPMPCE